MGNRQDELAWWKEQKDANGYETMSVSIAPGVSTLAFWVAQQILDGKEVPKDMIVPFLRIDQAGLETSLVAVGTFWPQLLLIQAVAHVRHLHAWRIDRHQLLHRHGVVRQQPRYVDVQPDARHQFARVGLFEQEIARECRAPGVAALAADAGGGAQILQGDTAEPVQREQ